MPGARMLVGNVELAAALAGRERDAPVAGWLVPRFDGFVCCADGGVVRGGIAWYKLAGAIAGFFVVVVAG